MRLGLVVCWCFLFAALPVHALTANTRQATIATRDVRTKSKLCDLHYFYDHGTEKCEFCCDICCKAKQKATTKQCQDECPEYAKKLQDDAKKIQDDSQDVETDPKAGQTAAWELPFHMQIAIPSAVCVLIVVVFLLFINRRAIINKFREWRSTAAAAVAAASPSGRASPIPELVPLQQVVSQQPTTNSAEGDLPVSDEREHLDPSSSSSSSSPSCSVPLGRRSTTVVRRESDKAGEGNSGQTWTSQQTASCHHPAARDPQSPVQESVAGREGASVMVLPNQRTRDTTRAKRIVESQTTL